MLAGVDPAAVTDRGALAQLPVIRKADLMERQSPAAPFGGLATLPVTAAARLFASPGPIYEFETARPGFWRLERALFAAGFRAGDIVHNCFRSEEHTSELQSLMRISYAVFCLKKKKQS